MKKDKTFAQLMLQLSHKNSISTVFSDFLEMSVCAMSLGMKEERYLEIVRRYDKPDVYLMSEAFGAMVLEMDNGGYGLRDIFGDFFMEHISYGHNGQFFTPEPICEMMAQIAGNIETGQSVYDCACGSGRTLLAAAKINRWAVFFGTDVDRNCCMMCLLNLCLNGLKGEVAWMNSLSNDFYGAWRIEIHPLHLVPYIREITEDECYQVLRRKEPELAQPLKPVPLPEMIPLKQQPVQQSLFGF